MHDGRERRPSVLRAEMSRQSVICRPASRIRKLAVDVNETLLRNDRRDPVSVQRSDLFALGAVNAVHDLWLRLREAFFEGRARGTGAWSSRCPDALVAAPVWSGLWDDRRATLVRSRQGRPATPPAPPAGPAAPPYARCTAPSAARSEPRAR